MFNNKIEKLTKELHEADYDYMLAKEYCEQTLEKRTEAAEVDSEANIAEYKTKTKMKEIEKQLLNEIKKQRKNK